MLRPTLCYASDSFNRVIELCILVISKVMAVLSLHIRYVHAGPCSGAKNQAIFFGES